MTDPVLHVLAGPNGSGKTTFYERVLAPVTHLRLVSADRLAAEKWPGEEAAHGYDAARLADGERAELLAARRSFVTETVFSHPSKVDLVTAARGAGYLVTLHVLLVPPDLSVLRVGDRVRRGGHDVPEAKIRARHGRLWTYVAEAVPWADEVCVYDNSSARTPFRVVASLRDGQPLVTARWPDWAPAQLRAAVG